MRLTTRLMQLASWLLLQRAVNEGELSAENARSEKEKVKFSATPSERGGRHRPRGAFRSFAKRIRPQADRPRAGGTAAPLPWWRCSRAQCRG